MLGQDHRAVKAMVRSGYTLAIERIPRRNTIRVVFFRFPAPRRTPSRRRQQQSEALCHRGFDQMDEPSSFAS